MKNAMERFIEWSEKLFVRRKIECDHYAFERGFNAALEECAKKARAILKEEQEKEKPAAPADK